MERKWINKSDICIIIGVLLLALLVQVGYNLYNSTSGSVYGEIYLYGKFITRVDLSKDAEFSIPNRENVIFTVKNGAVGFTKSDCPDKTCIETGFINQPGQLSACLPNGLSLKIVSEKTDIDAPDAIVR
jgi:hypothetical protein